MLQMTFLTPRAEAVPVKPDLAASVGSNDGAGRFLAHALADIRRGLPCVVAGPEGRIGVASAETVGEAGLVELIAWGGDASPLLLLAPGRAAALVAIPSAIGDAVALSVPPAALNGTALRQLADPTANPVPSGVRFAVALAATPPGATACLDLAKLGRLLPAVLVVRIPEGAEVAGAASVDVAAILAARLGGGHDLARVAEAAVPLADARDTRIVAFRAAADGMEHLAILVGRPEAATAPLVRIHSECFTGDLLGSLRCDCGPQLRGAIDRMAEEGAGAILYLAQEGRGIGLVNKLRAYALQDRGMDTLDANEALGWGADERDFGVAANMLRSLGLARVRLLTNNPRKIGALEQAGIQVERVSHLFASNGVNNGYLATKVERFGHLAD